MALNMEKPISGVINLNTRKPRTDRYYGIGQLDIFNGGLLLEGLINEDTSFLVSTRKSWIGEVLKAVAEAGKVLILPLLLVIQMSQQW